MVMTMVLAVQKTVVGQVVLPLYLKIIGWIATAEMAAAATSMIATIGQ
jgi:hypothetical protein